MNKNFISTVAEFALSAIKWDPSRKGGNSQGREVYDTRYETYDTSRPFTPDQLNMIYKKLKCVRLGVNRLASDLSSLPFKLVRKQSNGKEIDLTSMPLSAQWLETPNKYMNGKTLRKLLWMYKGIHSDMILEIPNGIDAPIKTVYPVPPNLLYIRSKGSFAIDHYELDDEYGGSGTIRSLNQIKRFYEPDPTDYTLSHSALNSCRLEIQTLFKAMGYNVNYFTNQASPSLNISTEEDMDEPEFEAWGKSMIRLLKGIGNAGKILVTDKGAKVNIIGNSPVESGYLDTINKAEEGILKSLGVNPALIDSKNVNRSNVTEYLKSYYEEAQSETDQFDAMMTEIINEDRIYYRTDYSKVPSLQKDAQKMTNSLSTQFKDGVITVDEYRVPLGMPADPLRGHMYFDEIKKELDLTDDNADNSLDKGKEPSNVKK